MSTFYAPGDWADEVELGEAAAHHANVKRLATAEVVHLTNGVGSLTDATIVSLGKKSLRVAVVPNSRREVASLPDVELWAPVGDRERMLWLAEKATELGVSSWRPVLYHRSRSVTPRGEGEAFRAKVEVRMIGALEQSGGAWLPRQHAELQLTQALKLSATGTNILLDGGGEAAGVGLRRASAPVALALGPEGGLEESERTLFVDAGWQLLSLGTNTLRFETAAIAGLTVLRHVALASVGA